MNEMQGLLGSYTGIPVFEDKSLREGTFVALDKNNMPIPLKDAGKTPIAKILVPDFEKFQIAMMHNQTTNDKATGEK